MQRAAQRGWPKPLLGMQGSAIMDLAVTVLFICTVALAFQTQLVDAVPMADNDQRVDVLVTADGVIECPLHAR